MISYLIIIEGDSSTNYSAYCPDLPGVAATGDSIDECAAEDARRDRLPHQGPARRRRTRATIDQPRANDRSRRLKRLSQVT